MDDDVDPSLVKAVAVEICKDPNLLEMIARAALGRVASKDDIDRLMRLIESTKLDLIRYVDARFEDIVARINGLDKRIDALDKRIDSLDKRISMLQWVIIIWLSVLSILILLH